MQIGATNWMHPNAGWRSAVIYSIVDVCRLQDHLTVSHFATGDPSSHRGWVEVAGHFDPQPEGQFSVVPRIAD
jgi:hypothetical protein